LVFRLEGCNFEQVKFPNNLIFNQLFYLHTKGAIMKKSLLFMFIVGLLFASTNLYAQGMSGSYYIGAAGTGPGGSNPEFTTFREALDSINNATFSGNCVFYITSDITETYSDSRGIGLAVNPEPYTITFKPYTGIQPTITFNYPTDLNGGPSGAFVIGIPGKGNVAWDSLRTTKNIIIDGSNTVDGTTRDLTLTSATTAQRNAFPLTIVGDVSNMVIKNTKIYYKAAGLGSTSGNLFLGAIHVRSRNYLSINWVPRDILFENNHISADFDGVALNAQGYITYQSGTPLPLDYPYNITLKNNLIEGKRRAVSLYRAGSHDIIGNDIRLNQNVSATVTSEAIYAVDVDTNSVVNIYNNKVSKVSGITNAANVGIAGINIETFGTYNVFNNFIYGFELTAANPVSYVYGIKNSSANATLNSYFNTVYMTDMLAGGTINYYGVLISNGTNELKNNIIYSDVTDFASYCIYRSGSTGTLVANNNDYYFVDATNGNVGYWDASATQTLAAWQTASSQDANSKSKAVNFASATDLHLAGASIGDVDLFGVPIAGITTDIDGDIRSTTEPYMGADEAIVPGLQGTYYVGAPGTGPGGIDPHYSTLKAACTALNTETILGDVQMIITSNLVEPANVGLGVDPSPYTITFKPMAGTVDTILFTQVADNPGASGAWVIGAPDLTVTSASNYGLVTTNNIVIDGSNTIDGSTRDLVVMTNTGIASATYPIRIIGDVNNTVVKNTKFTTLQSVSYGFLVTVRFSTNNYVPDDITVDNCEIVNTVSGTGQGLAISNSGTPTQFPTGIVFKNNHITAKTRGIFLNYAGNTDVHDNTIYVNQVLTGYMSYGIWGYVIGDASNVQNIYNNKIMMLASANANSGSYGIIGIEAASKGTYNIYNNMITGFLATATGENPSMYMIGVRNVTAAVTANIYFNSIYLPEQTINPGTGTINYAGIWISNGTNDVKNNIVYAAEADFPSYCIYRAGANGTLVSDHNDFYAANATNGNVGYWDNAPAQTLAAWQTASGQDANSISADPLFVAVDDLHLQNTTSPVVGKGIQIPGFAKDIDGNDRDSIPEIGAHEFPGVIPVELVSFVAASNGNSVVLSWETATETNNSHFEIEKRSENNAYTTIGKVTGAGTTVQPVKYSFTDNNPGAAKVYYRLKQVDFDGSFSYSKEVEADVEVPTVFELSQNYPNPFNPSTTIRYAIPEDARVTLEVYSILGELVATLVNDVQPAGKYNVVFNAAKFASGTYVYRLTANQTVITKKMLLIK